MKTQCQTIRLTGALAAILVVFALGSGRAAAQTITEIIDSTGDGAGNGLNGPIGIAVDTAGNVYVPGLHTNNAFKITPPYGAANATEIIDATGDGAGNVLIGPAGIAVDAAGNAYLTGQFSHNAFKITPAGVVTEIIDSHGDGANPLTTPFGIAVDAAGNAYVAGGDSDNAFKITPAKVITEIIDAGGDGAGNTLNAARGIAVDAAGNVYVGGFISDNAFKITPAGDITEIIDATGDGAGNVLNGTEDVRVDAAGNVYLPGEFSDNAFKITPACPGDANGDGTVDPLDSGFVLARFGCDVGTGDPDCDAADQNGDGAVDPLDSGFVLARFGECS